MVNFLIRYLIMRYTRIVIRFIPLILAIFIGYFFIYNFIYVDNSMLMSIETYFKDATFDLFSLFAVSFSMFALFSALNTVLENKSLPISHNVAIVGFPKSGKTTLIISLFGEIFAGKILSVRAKPKGVKSIERINESLEMLRKGRALGPTKDQDRFAFRADITVKRGILPRTYKVEFGDFPGEDSEMYSFQYGSWLHNTEYFKWVVDSDAIIFVIDIGRYMVNSDERQNYVGQISSALRAAWQNFSDLNEHNINNLKKFPIILAFTKADLFGYTKNFDDFENIEAEIMQLGYGDETPPIKDINPDSLRLGKNQVMNDFEELIKYYESESSHFRVIFVSSFGLHYGKRLGIEDLMQSVLP